ncbi:MAG: hypothetical protein DCE90_07160 [Pseudanabaena sp.]|nr:MAG: hypothetical protein DCE90_07160 [Pseudanabaena sp.]
MSSGQSRTKNHSLRHFPLVVLGVLTGILSSLSGCSNSSKTEAIKPPTAVFLSLQASPDGTTIEGLVPSDLVEQAGNLDRIVQSIPAESQFALTQFGKSLATFQVSAVQGSDNFGAIAVFKVQATSDPNSLSTALKQQNLTIVQNNLQGDGQTNSSSDRSYFFNCPNKIQPLVLEKSRKLFIDLGAAPTTLPKVTIASTVCADLDADNQPEIIAGLRLDNSDRPAGFDTQAWQVFLSKPALARQEYSMLVVLRKVADQDWFAEPILTHTRSLSYINDSVSTYVLHGIQELNGDQSPELVVKEIGLNYLDAKVLTPTIGADGKWQWRNYYQNQRSLNIVQ